MALFLRTIKKNCYEVVGVNPINQRKTNLVLRIINCLMRIAERGFNKIEKAKQYFEE